MKDRIKTLRLACVFCALMLVWGSFGVKAEVVDRVVAVVNGEIITLFELNQKIKPYLKRFQGQEIGPEEKKSILDVKRKTLDKMVENVLIQQKAEEYGIEVTDMEVDNRVRQIKNRNKLDNENFEQELKKRGMTREEYAQKIKRNILRHRLIQAMVKRKVVVTDEEIRTYYKKHKGDYTQEKKAQLSLILLPDLDKAKEIYRLLQKEEISFKQAAVEFSVGPRAEEGGDLGYVDWSSMNESFKKALQGVEPKEITEPFEFRDNVALLQLRKLQEGKAKPLSEVRKKISDQLYKKKFSQQYDDYLTQLKEEAVIDIRL